MKMEKIIQEKSKVFIFLFPVLTVVLLCWFLLFSNFLVFYYVSYSVFLFFAKFLLLVLFISFWFFLAAIDKSKLTVLQKVVFFVLLAPVCFFTSVSWIGVIPVVDSVELGQYRYFLVVLDDPFSFQAPIAEVRKCEIGKNRKMCIDIDRINYFHASYEAYLIADEERQEVLFFGDERLEDFRLIAVYNENSLSFGKNSRSYYDVIEHNGIMYNIGYKIDDVNQIVTYHLYICRRATLECEYAPFQFSYDYLGTTSSGYPWERVKMGLSDNGDVLINIDDEIIYIHGDTPPCVAEGCLPYYFEPE